MRTAVLEEGEFNSAGLRGEVVGGVRILRAGEDALEFSQLAAEPDGAAGAGNWTISAALCVRLEGLETGWQVVLNAARSSCIRK